MPPDGTPRVLHYERVNLNWGRGAGVGVTIGRSLNEHVGIELRSTWFPSARTTWHSEEGFGVYDESIEMTFLRVEPALRLSTSDSTSGWYVAIGPSFALFPQSRSAYEEYLTYPTETHYVAYAWNTYGGVGMGAFVAMGFTYRTKGRCGFFGEINCTAQSWSPNRSDAEKYIFFGEDELPTLSTSQLIRVYVNEYSTDENADPDVTSKYLRFHNPMSSWGVRAGLQYNLGSRK